MILDNESKALEQFPARYAASSFILKALRTSPSAEFRRK
jgi:hypothetical protein